MRIGFDGGCLANRRGFGRFARQTLAALAAADHPHEFVVLVDRPSAEAVAVPSNMRRVVVGVRDAPSLAASSTGRRSVADLLAMGRAAAKARLDLLYFPATYSFFPVWNCRRVVVTMHDTLAVARPDLVFPTRGGRIAWALKEHLAAWRADRVMTVSESARRDLIAWFRLPSNKVRVMPEGPEACFEPRPHGEESDRALRRSGVEPGSRFLLYVGGLSPHKNLGRLVEAFARSGLAGEGHRLVLVGDTGDVFHTHVPELRAAVERLGLGGSVHFTGYVPDPDLVYLYNRAEALAQPSLWEGFGLPVVEAMACGTPVVAAAAGSLPEVVGDAGLFFDPLDVGAMAGCLRRVADDPMLRAGLAGRAVRRAAHYTWPAAAEVLLDCFDELDPAKADDRRPAPAPAPSPTTTPPVVRRRSA